MSQIFPTVTCSRCNAKFNENNMNMLTRYEEWKKYEKEMLSKKLRDRFSNKDEEFIKKKISELPESFICKSCTYDFYLEILISKQDFIKKKEEEKEEKIFGSISGFVAAVGVVDGLYSGVLEGFGDSIVTFLSMAVLNYWLLFLFAAFGYGFDKSKIKGELSLSEYERVKRFGSAKPFRSNYRLVFPVVALVIFYKYIFSILTYLFKSFYFL